MWNRSSRRGCTIARPCWQRFASWWPPVLGTPPPSPPPRRGEGWVGVRLRRAVHSPAGVDEPATDVRKRDFYLGSWVALSGERTRGMPKILLVEDNEMNRDMLSRRLERRGYQVIIAVDGQEGVALAQSQRPDLILMDMSLPVLDGWEATRQLKAAPATRSIPIIALTANAMSGDREQALEAGCDDYDSKPVEFARLLGKIQGLLNKEATA